MYENKLYEKIKQSILDLIKDIDKREGSIVDTLVSPVAMELEGVYQQLEKILSVLFIGDSYGAFLDRHANQYGVYRMSGVFAVGEITFQGIEGTMIRKGTLVATSNNLLYETLFDAIIPDGQTEATVGIRAEYEGAKYNVNHDTVTKVPVSIPGIVSVSNRNAISGGSDLENDEELKQRLKDVLSKTAADGNVAQYMKWASEFDGIGRAKVFPLWLGGNTVKVSITNANNQVATDELVEKFQVYLDPEGNGLGNGKAPIGAKVTVSSGIKKDIDIRCEVKLAQGYTTPDGIAECIVKFLSDITYSKGVISYMQLGSQILNVPSVADIRNLFICGSQVDVVIGDEEIPMLNNLNVVVI